MPWQWDMPAPWWNEDPDGLDAGPVAELSRFLELDAYLDDQGIHTA